MHKLKRSTVVRNYYRCAFWMCMVYLVALILFTGSVFYAGWAKVISSFFSDFYEEVLGVGVPLAVRIIFSLGFLPFAAVYSLVACVLTMADFYRRSRDKKQGKAVLDKDILLFSPLLLWFIFLTVSWCFLVVQLHLNGGDVTYLSGNGQVTHFEWGSMPPLWFALGIPLLLALPFWARLFLPFYIWLRKSGSERISSPSWNEFVSVSKKKWMFVGVATVLVVSLMVVIRYSQNREKDAAEGAGNFPVKEISRIADQVRGESYVGQRFATALNYAKNHEFDGTPYLITAMVQPDWKIKDSLGLIINWIGETGHLRAIQIQHIDSNHVLKLNKIETILSKNQQPDSVPIMSVTIRAKVTNDTEVPKIVEEAKEKHIAVPAEALQSEYKIRLIDAKGQKSNWIPLYVHQ